MPSTLTLSADGTYIYGQVAGDVTLTISLRILAEIMAMASSSGARKTLIDVRGITAPLDTLELHQFRTTVSTDHQR